MPNVDYRGIGGADHGVKGRFQDHKNPVYRAGLSKQLFYQKLNEVGHYNVEVVTLAKVPRDSEDWINNPDEILTVLKHTMVMIDLVAKDETTRKYTELSEYGSMPMLPIIPTEKSAPLLGRGNSARAIIIRSYVLIYCNSKLQRQ
ncbi:hypothetical protein BFW01_g6834 [Lasiodiplodia theobromae]|uniref:Uncharacterized protein n=1 Tax=Lasiodiplodia theobromae TaxID=45133 RepID=A0A5N5DXM2_9PEZI|nr:GTPase activating protein (Tsc2) [Lasiodiplodia theobromae]KAB2580874.1 hypothetical protein DBV05_g500 [Lasiodiplodia theobromae]KAF4542479.1 GTPase activating protein (Tsc2) [Lasiodiplodia theobromae]KAF9635939.1 hypothetical protein BFW01_g6834 [Lasiodiplodia theobromae]